MSPDSERRARKDRTNRCLLLFVLPCTDTQDCIFDKHVSSVFQAYLNRVIQSGITFKGSSVGKFTEFDTFVETFGVYNAFYPKEALAIGRNVLPSFKSVWV